VGAQGVLSITPYYNKPTQEGMYRHFMTIADEGGLPMVLYNVPGRTGVSIAPETVARLAAHENVVGIKEASGSLDQASAILSLCDITLVSGDDSLTLPLLSVGGKGVISVVANVVPADVKAMIAAFNAGEVAEATDRHRKLFPLCRAMFYETNPIPVKTAMRLLGRLNGELRLPLCPMSKANEARLKQALTDYGLL
jgi:4-hydroxy-tetrahydrodipicolinate synthase